MNAAVANAAASASNSGDAQKPKSIRKKYTEQRKWAFIYDPFKPLPRRLPEKAQPKERPPPSPIASQSFDSAALLTAPNVNPLYSDKFEHIEAKIDPKALLVGKDKLEHLHIPLFPKGSYGNFAIGSFLNDLKKSHFTKRASFRHKSSRFIERTAQLFYEERLIRGYKLIPPCEIEVFCRHSVTGRSLIRDIQMVSTPARKVYMSFDEVKRDMRRNRHRNWLIVSTPKGLMPSHKAVKEGHGGAIIARVTLA